MGLSSILLRKKARYSGTAYEPHPETTAPTSSLCPWTWHEAGGCTGTPQTWQWVHRDPPSPTVGAWGPSTLTVCAQGPPSLDSGCTGTPQPRQCVHGVPPASTVGARGPRQPRLPAPRSRRLPVPGSGSAFPSSSSGLSEIKRSSGVCSQPSFTCDPSELRLRQRALFPGPAEGMFYS